MLYELDVVDGLLQLERILFPDRGRHLVERVVNGRHGRVHQAAGSARGRCPVASGPAGCAHETTQRVGGRTVAGRWRRDRCGWHVHRRAHAGHVQSARCQRQR